ncbi:S1C family serine protease [Isoptericola aurantiacus]|uniref:S1C family serine protease n=1 Tax=Isoptericola aurantiacus TaxID=3377839 RepID=UPI00383B271F
MTSQDPTDLFATPEPPARRPQGPPAAPHTAAGAGTPPVAPPPGPPSSVPPSVDGPAADGPAVDARPAARPTGTYPAYPGPSASPAPFASVRPGPVQHGPTDAPSGPGSPTARSGARGGGARTALILVLALVAGLVGGVVGNRVSDGGSQDAPVEADLPVAPDGQGDGADLSRPAGSVASIAADVLPSVVSLEVAGDDGAGATGSGFVLREDGYVLTNAHVAGAGGDDGEVVVVLSDGSEHPGEIVGLTTDYDLAVVKIDADGLTPLVLGDSDDVVVGDEVLAVGAPLGLDSTVTSGIVSALHRPVQAGDQATTAFIDAIQTDAAINPGNSGGPLVDADGQVVGINSAIAQAPGAMQATGSIGLGFAIPANQARTTAEQLIETGTATYPVIGVLLDTGYGGEGVKVAEDSQQGNPPVTPDGPADLAGIRAGDVILEIDGRPVSRSDELIVAIRARQPGDAVTLRVRSGEEERDVRVVLQESSGT